jgi:hypothetical protein
MAVIDTRPEHLPRLRNTQLDLTLNNLDTCTKHFVWYPTILGNQ